MADLALTKDFPEPPYYAVIFTSTLTGEDTEGYSKMGDRLDELAKKQPGYLGLEGARSGVGISVSYWEDEASLLAWKKSAVHEMAQKLGHEKWYQRYNIRISKVERQYCFEHSSSDV